MLPSLMSLDFCGKIQMAVKSWCYMNMDAQIDALY